VNPGKAVRDHCKGVPIWTPLAPLVAFKKPARRIGPTSCVSSSSARFQERMRFEQWIFEEVLPSITTTGSYGNHMAPVAIGAIVK
jgi:anti-repressor protein